MIQTPELDKIKKNKIESEAIGAFLEWLETTDMVIASPQQVFDDSERKELTPIYFNIEQLLAQYFGINLTNAEKEHMALLDEFRKRTS